MSDYPGAVDSFATKVDYVDDVLAAHVNDLQAAVVAVQTELGTDPAGAYATVRAWLEALAVRREVLTANRTYYVRADGSDSNTGLSDTSGGAFLTIQKALDTIGGLDISNYTVTIQVRDGTYTENLTFKSPLGSGSLVLQGNSGSPANVLITKSTGTILNFTNCAQSWTVKDLKITGDSGVTVGINAQGGTTTVYVNNIIFNGNLIDMRSQNSALIIVTGNYAITAGGGYHWDATLGGSITASSKTITISGTPAYSIFCLATLLGVVNTAGCTFGSTTGTRYLSNLNSVIQTNGGGASYFPGDVAGATATGGQYA